jgi:Flp pilus assembly pilin Flp
MNFIKRLCADRAGTAAVEMGAILLIIAVGTLAGVSGIGSSVKTSYENTANSVKEATK